MTEVQFKQWGGHKQALSSICAYARYYYRTQLSYFEFMVHLGIWLVVGIAPVLAKKHYSNPMPMILKHSCLRSPYSILQSKWGKKKKKIGFLLVLSFQTFSNHCLISSLLVSDCQTPKQAITLPYNTNVAFQIYSISKSLGWCESFVLRHAWAECE